MSLILIISIVLIYFSETFSWYFKSLTKQASAGVISFGNMIMYSSRIFAFAYQFSISFLIGKELTLVISIALFLCGIFHIIFLKNKILLKKIAHIYIWLLKKCKIVLKESTTLDFNSSTKLIKHSKIYFFTFISTLAFNISLTIPYLVSIMFPDYRLTIVSFIPILNFMGAIPIVFYVDNYLFQYMDKGEVDSVINNYYKGRIHGFLVTSMIILALFFI